MTIVSDLSRCHWGQYLVAQECGHRIGLVLRPLVREETFGPPVPIIRVRDIDHAIEVANSTVFGLSSGVCTNRMDDIIRFIKELETGTVNIWEVPVFRIELLPFVGIKYSGFVKSAC